MLCRATSLGCISDQQGEHSRTSTFTRLSDTAPVHEEYAHKGNSADAGCLFDAGGRVVLSLHGRLVLSGRKDVGVLRLPVPETSQQQ